MGKNITRRKKNGKRITKNNRRKKIKGGAIVRAGEELNFNPKLVTKKISWTKVDMIDKFNKKFCDALHVKLLNPDGSDSTNGFYFFYNYTYGYYGSMFSNNVGYEFLKKISHSLSFKGISSSDNRIQEAENDIFKDRSQYYKEEYRSDDMKTIYNGVYIAYKKNKILLTIDRNDRYMFHYNYFIPFLNINDIITKFDFDKDITVDKYGNRRDKYVIDYYNEKETFYVSFTIYDKSLHHDIVATKEEVKNKLNAFFNGKEYIEQNPERTRVVQHSTDLPESNTGKQLWNAILNKNVVMLNQLATSADAQGISINYTDPEGRPPIYFAIKLKESSVLKELLKHKCFDVNQQNNRGDTPLHLAIYRRDIEKLKLLVEKPEIIIDGKAFSLNEEFNNKYQEFYEIKEILINKIITSSPASTTRRYTADDL